MNVDPLARAIAAAMIFLEESSPDEVDPDAAIRGLESISFEILHLVGSDRDDFLEIIERVADSYSDSHDAEFVRRMPWMIGMVDV